MQSYRSCDYLETIKYLEIEIRNSGIRKLIFQGPIAVGISFTVYDTVYMHINQLLKLKL